MGLKKIHASPDRRDSDQIMESFKSTLTEEVQRCSARRPLPIFFRADDIGVVSGNLLRLLQLFQDHRLPLCLAVVPAWLTKPRWSVFSTLIDVNSRYWCWHQHGWTHTNHQKSGKKCEFGSERPPALMESDIVRGRKRLESIIGSSFYPAFTPPWNRCTETTAKILRNQGFTAISRSLGEQQNPVCLPDCFVNIDLHTRKEADPRSSFQGLLFEWRQALKQGRIGVMIHHQLMDKNDFVLLEWLLKTTVRSSKLEACTFAQLEQF